MSYEVFQSALKTAAQQFSQLESERAQWEADKAKLLRRIGELESALGGTGASTDSPTASSRRPESRSSRRASPPPPTESERSRELATPSPSEPVGEDVLTPMASELKPPPGTRGSARRSSAGPRGALGRSMTIRRGGLSGRTRGGPRSKRSRPDSRFTSLPPKFSLKEAGGRLAAMDGDGDDASAAASSSSSGVGAAGHRRRKPRSATTTSSGGSDYTPPSIIDVEDRVGVRLPTVDCLDSPAHSASSTSIPGEEIAMRPSGPASPKGSEPLASSNKGGSSRIRPPSALGALAEHASSDAGRSHSPNAPRVSAGAPKSRPSSIDIGGASSPMAEVPAPITGRGSTSSVFRKSRERSDSLASVGGGSAGNASNFTFKFNPRLALREHTSAVEAVAFHPDQPVLASADHGGSLRVWDLGKALRVPSGYARTPMAANGASEGSVQPITTLRGHAAPVRSLAFADTMLINKENRSDVIVSGGDDAQVILWSLSPGARPDTLAPSAWQRRVLIGPQDAVTSVAVQSYKNLVLATSKDETTRLWKPTGGHDEPVSQLRHPMPGVIPTCAQFQPLDYSQVLVGYSNGDVALFDVTRQRMRSNLSTPAQVNHLACHPSFPLAFAAQDDGYIRFLDFRSKEITHELRAHPESVTRVVTTPFGMHIGSASMDGSVRFWDVGQHSCVMHVDAHHKGALALEHHSTLPLLATGGGESLIRVYRQ